MYSLLGTNNALYIMELKPFDPSSVDRLHWYGKGKYFFTNKGAYEVLI